jgi:hypothetical protein
MPSSVRAAYSHTANIRRVSRNYHAIAGPGTAFAARPNVPDATSTT